MPDIGIQFHATLGELSEFAVGIVDEFKLYTVAISFAPFNASSIDFDELPQIFASDRNEKRLSFSLSVPILSVSDELAFADWNPDALTLDIARENQQTLRQSFLSARTDNQKALAIWRKAATRLKNITKAGVNATNQKTGVTCRIRSFRYTHGAKELMLSGVKMLPFAGSSLLTLE